MAEENVTQILVAIGQVSKQIEGIEKSIADHEGRLRVIEGQGGKKWDAIVSQFITLCVGGFVGWAISNFIK